MRFRPNKMRYYQDFEDFQGIPHGIDFEVSRLFKTGFWLRAPGYGVFGSRKSYGNGQLLVLRKDLSARQIARFERAVGAAVD